MEPIRTKPIFKSAAQAVVPYKNTVIEIVMVIIAAGLFFWYLLRPQMNTVSLARQKLAVVLEEASTMEEKRAQLDQLVKQMKAGEKDDLPKLDEALPLQPQVSRLYYVIEQYGQVSGLTVGSIGINTGVEAIVAGNRAMLENPFGVKRTVKKLTANVTLSGTFEQFQAFLKNIESHPRIIDISSLDISGTQGGIIDFKFSLTSYYYE